MTENVQDNDGEMKAVQEWRADHDKPMTVSHTDSKLESRSLSQYQ